MVPKPLARPMVPTFRSRCRIRDDTSRNVYRKNPTNQKLKPRPIRIGISRIEQCRDRRYGWEKSLKQEFCFCRSRTDKLIDDSKQSFSRRRIGPLCRIGFHLFFSQSLIGQGCEEGNRSKLACGRATARTPRSRSPLRGCETSVRLKALAARGRALVPRSFFAGRLIWNSFWLTRKGPPSNLIR